MSTTSRENILNKIKQALKQQVPVPFNQRKESFVYKNASQELEIEFAENFTKLQGKFSFCANIQELVEQLSVLVEAQQWKKVVCNETQLHQQLSSNQFNQINNQIALVDCDVAITTCEALVARTGSLLLSSNTRSGRTFSVYAPIHICIAFTNQLVYDIGDAIEMMKKKYGNNLPSVVSLATGPSRTADIEKTLVVGVHGPKEVYCFLVDKA
ncbi:MAG: lactate utilization protein [Bacteroidetes bacterium]|nr:lactate utilization protein [Bacteroidota bacterium]